MWGLWVCFLMPLKIKKVASKKLSQMTLKHTAVVLPERLNLVTLNSVTLPSDFIFSSC